MRPLNGRGPRDGGPRSMSIRLRLTLWYSALLALVLAIFTILLYGFFTFRLHAEVDRELDTRRDQLEGVIQDAVRREPLLFLRTGRINIPPIDVFSSPGIVVQVMRATDGEVLVSSENAGGSPLPRDAATLDPARNGQNTYVTIAGENRVRFRLLTAPILVGGRVVGIIQVAGSLQSVERTLNLLGLSLLIGTLAALTVAALIGYGLAGSALKPIDEIARAAHAIAQTRDLEKRVRETHNADEVDRLAITFNEMLQRLENLFLTQQRFLADVSHELRTPLTIIRGNLALLFKTSAPDTQEVVRTIDGEAGRMSRLIADLLLLAQSDAGAVSMKHESVEMDTLLLDVYRQARVMAAQRDGNLKIVLGEEDQAVVDGDPDRLKQLALNLVDNAIKYTPGGEIRLSLHKQNRQVGLRVSDTGPGIPPADVPHIFERFYRVDKARTRETGGTGLGLSIVDWIAKMHGGYVQVQSEPGKGSVFTLWLPEKGNGTNGTPPASQKQ
ncbi:MAG: HAMP domain-containing histidine kinase [Chloroflexi bacterium]|nr:HAMP domain-containing histidine kinase [Chloroflexota bacterium]